MGDAGGFLRHSSRRSGASSHPSTAGGVVDGLITVYHWNQETGGGTGYPGWSCCRSPVQNPRLRIPLEPGASAWWERSPGSPTIRGIGLVGEISWLS